MRLGLSLNNIYIHISDTVGEFLQEAEATVWRQAGSFPSVVTGGKEHLPYIPDGKGCQVACPCPSSGYGDGRKTSGYCGRKQSIEWF